METSWKTTIHGGSMRHLRVLFLVSGAAACAVACSGDSTAASRPASISIYPSTLSIHDYQAALFIATLLNSDGQPMATSDVVWSIDDSTIARPIGPGAFAPLRFGTTTVHAASAGQVGTASLSIVPVPLSGIAVVPSSLTLTAGDSLQLRATITDSIGRAVAGAVAWSTSDRSVAAVSASGRVSAIAAGAATITAAFSGLSATALVTVQLVPVYSVTVSAAPSSAFNLYEGDSVQLTATARDIFGNALAGRSATWTSSKPQYASVSSGGLVRAAVGQNAGSTAVTITATIDGKSGTRNVLLNGWRYFAPTIDPVTLQSLSSLSLFSDPIGSSEGMTLEFRCVSHNADAYVATSSITNSGAVTYRFANSGAQNATWNEATNFQALFYPGDAFTFASQVGSSDTLFFQYTKYLGGTTHALFITRSMRPYLDSLRSHC